jgi:hypothetical protein
VQVKQGRLNFTTVVDLPEGAPVLTGTFSISGRPVIILFDSGATHSFINVKTFRNLDLKWCHTKQAYMIATPGGKVASNQVALSVPLEIGNKIFPTNLVTIVGDSPRGPLKQWEKPHLKPTTRPKHNSLNHAGNSPQGL